MTQHTPGGRGAQIIALYTILPAITTIAFGLRIYVRTRLVKLTKGWLEDWTAGIGWALFVSYSSFGLVAVYHGLGQHAHLISPEELPIALKWWWCCVPFYAVSNIAVKLSIAIMLLRFVVEDYHRRMIYIVTGVTEVYGVAYLFGFMFQCTPVSYFWNNVRENSTGHCVNPKIIVVASYGYSVITLIYDWTMAILPWFVVRKTRLDVRTKLMVAFVLALGSIASVATVVRIPYVPDLSDRSDFLYTITDVTIWSCCETGLSITASSLATTKPLFRRASPDRVRMQSPKLEAIPLSSDAFSSGNTTTLCNSETGESRVKPDIEAQETYRSSN